jgi:hypothetical protein
MGDSCPIDMGDTLGRAIVVGSHEGNRLADAVARAREIAAGVVTPRGHIPGSGVMFGAGAVRIVAQVEEYARGKAREGQARAVRGP